MSYYLAKTEPGTYSIEDLEREGRTVWDGVTNPLAVRAIREMRPDDRVLIYHSGGVSAIVGLAAVRSAPRDPPTTLAEVKQSKLFSDWALVRQGRLSTMPVPQAFVEWLRKRYPGTKI